MSAEKCPHCGAPEQPDSSPRMPRRGAGNYPWSCGTLRDTIRPIRSSKCYENELANIQSKLALAEDKLANTEKMLSDLYKAHDVVKLTLNGWKERAIKHEARVKELEGLKFCGCEREEFGVCVSILVPNSKLPINNKATTLGESMPRKEQSR